MGVRGNFSLFWYGLRGVESAELKRLVVSGDKSFKEKCLENAVSYASSPEWKEHYELFQQRRRLLISGLKQKFGENVVILRMKAESPVLVGLGMSHPGDMPGMFLSRNYGFPYIPASSVKGVLRSVATQLIGVTSADDAALINADNLLPAFLFGFTGFKGVLDFLDAVPLNVEGILERDIINCHHGGYYTKGEPPIDTENPVPVQFLRIRSGIEFEFGYILDNDYKNRWDVMLELLKKSPRVLEEEIKNFAKKLGLKTENLFDVVNLLFAVVGMYYGFGAKTRVGYGRFKLVGSRG